MTESKKELAATKKRISELDGLIRGLYEDRQLGHMPARQVDRLIAQYDQEQEELESKVSSLEVKIEEEKSGRSDPERFLKAIRKYRDFDELTQDMVFELIDRIDVHQADMEEETGERSQQIDITFSLIGNYQPAPEAVAFEIAQGKEKLQRRLSGSESRMSSQNSMRRSARPKEGLSLRNRLSMIQRLLPGLQRKKKRNGLITEHISRNGKSRRNRRPSRTARMSHRTHSCP